MTDHPITPPPELVEKWDEEGTEMFRPAYQIHLTTRAAQWGADQELEACCEWMSNRTVVCPRELRAARRPKPPNLKEQALALIDGCTDPEGDYLDDNALSIIRRALEALPDD